MPAAAAPRAEEGGGDCAAAPASRCLGLKILMRRRRPATTWACLVTATALVFLEQNGTSVTHGAGPTHRQAWSSAQITPSTQHQHTNKTKQNQTNTQTSKQTNKQNHVAHTTQLALHTRARDTHTHRVLVLDNGQALLRKRVRLGDRPEPTEVAGHLGTGALGRGHALDENRARGLEGDLQLAATRARARARSQSPPARGVMGTG